MAKRAGKGIFLVVAGLAVLAGLAGWWALHRGVESTDDAAIEASVIPVSPKVSGYVVALSIADNQTVRKGDVLLKIDPRDYVLAVEEAKAGLASAQARMEAAQFTHNSTTVSAPSDLESARAQVESAMADWKNKVVSLKRLQALDDTARTRKALDDAVAGEKSARSALDSAQARLRSAQTAPDKVAASRASVRELQADVEKAQAALDIAQKNLDDTVLVAPQDGRVTRRTVEVGAYVAPGQQLFTLVGRDLWVVANFKETQLSGMKPGQRVDIQVDAYPDQTFRGRLDSIQAGTGARFSLFPPENATGNFVKVVQRVPVKIVFDEKPGGQFALGPGMSVVPTVHVQ